MSDKSPRQGMSKKSGKSIKEKRAEKRDKGHVEQADRLIRGLRPDSGENSAAKAAAGEPGAAAPRSETSAPRRMAAHCHAGRPASATC